jgi:hypothetical protein
VPTSAYPGHYPRPLLVSAILFLVALVGTYSERRRTTSSTRAPQEFPRSEELFVAVVGLHFTPGYLLCENEPGKTPRLLQADESNRLPFTVPILGQAQYSALKGLFPLTTLSTCISCVAITAS